MTVSAPDMFSASRGPSMMADAAAMLSAPAERFSSALHEAARSGRRDQLRQAVTQLVSTALVKPVLSSLRESRFLTGPFAPGAAEKRFGPLLDQHIADRVVNSANFPMIDVMVERIWRPAATLSGQAAGAAPEEHVDASA